MKNIQKKWAYNSILLKISILVIALCGIIIIYSVNTLYIGWSDYQQAKEWNTIQDITSPFATTLKNFMFERGRMNVVLSAHDPISIDNRSFINERRKATDEALETALSIMEKKYSKEAEVLRNEHDKLKVLRI